jgi:hypothetical protein
VITFWGIADLHYRSGCRAGAGPTAPGFVFPSIPQKTLDLLDFYERILAVYIPAAELYERIVTPPFRIGLSDRTNLSSRK